MQHSLRVTTEYAMKYKISFAILKDAETGLNRPFAATDFSCLIILIPSVSDKTGNISRNGPNINSYQNGQ